VAIAQARLNVDGRFALAAFTPLFPPLAAAAATLAFATDLGVFAPAAGVLAGQVLQALILIAALPGHQKVRLRGITLVTHLPAVRAFFLNYGLLVGAALMLGGVSWVDQAVAAHLGSDAVAHLAYANRPVFLFAAFATIAVANVALPGFTEYAARRNHNALRTQLTHGVLWIAAMSVIALPAWGLLTPQIVALLYERGAFSATDTATVSALQRWSLGQIPFYLVAALAWRMLNALQANGFVLAVTAACFAINLALTVPLAAMFGVRGILAGTILAFAIWCLVLVIGVRRRLR
jgi:putative peptidoglycan lipid II flippase